MIITSNKKISVITVCLNAADLLLKTIRSVVEQTYQHVEYIIIDGASKDNTLEIVHGFGTSIHKLISEPDRGLYDAMNKGVNAATGDLIIFLNAGDYFISSNVLEFVISKMNLKEADLFFGRIIWNDPRNKDIVLSDHSWCNFTWDLKKSNFPHPATFYKKELFDQIGLFNLDYPIAADYEWNVRALVFKKIQFQYMDIVVTVFFADGISNNPTLAVKHKSEIKQIDNHYYKPLVVHQILEKRESFLFKKFIEKFLSKIYNCRLSRVYY